MINYCTTTSSLHRRIAKKLSLEVNENADKIVSCKIEWGEKNEKKIQNIINSYKNMKDKIIFIFLVSDHTNPLSIPENVRLYRTSFLKSKQQKNEFLLPYIWEHIENPSPPLEKGHCPIVGFCGLNCKHRGPTLNAFKKNSLITSNFIVRKQFWAGKPRDRTKVIKDFNDNIANSHFTVGNRGVGNFSMRFYQTLSAGRIPILLDTDIPLPFSDEIDWENTIVLGKTPDELVEKVLDFWNNRDIVKLQIKCKDIYDKYFSGTKYLDRILS
jgi:hypothetical protein|tara:strand:- start:238 stop:1047 length:810 start_codon:yes stop_codon:yes gene_type:complete